MLYWESFSYFPDTLVPGLNTFSSTPCHNSYTLSGCVITHTRTPPSIPRVHSLQLSRTRSGLVYKPRGFLAVTVAPSRCSYDSTKSFAESSVPQTSSAPPYAPPLIYTIASVFHTITSNATVLVDVLTSVAPSPSITEHTLSVALGPSAPQCVQLGNIFLVLVHFLFANTCRRYTPS